MNSRTAKLINRFSQLKQVPSRLLKTLWNQSPSPSRRLARLQMKSQILKTLNETLSNPNQITGLQQPSERETIDGSRY